MRYILIVILASMVAVLSCSPPPQNAENNSDTQTEVTSTDNAEAIPAYEPGSWTEDWETAISAAQEMQRPILVNFTGSDWCVWCMRLKDEVFSQEEFQSYAKDNLIMLKLDFPREIKQSDELKKQNNDLLQEFGVQGFPTILLLNGEGKEIARTGYQRGGVSSYVKHLQQLLEQN